MTRKSAMESLIERFPVRILSSGKTLFQQDDKADLAYYVHRGQFVLSSSTLGGQETELGRAVPGDLLGLETICSPQYFTTAVCLRTARIAALPRSDLLSLVAAEPEFAGYLLEKTVHALCDVREMLLNLHCRSSLQRVALYLAKEVGEEQHLLLPWGSHLHLAKKLGMSQETLSRALRRLTSRGVITLDRERVTIVDIERLREISSDAGSLQYDA